MQGRKTKQESRADEFRQRLLAWKQIPESLRPSLRELARELGTSHQLLEHYLGGLEKWQHKERHGMASPEMEEMRSSVALESTAIRSFISSAWLGHIAKLKELRSLTQDDGWAGVCRS
jgi:hypothetical protein